MLRTARLPRLWPQAVQPWPRLYSTATPAPRAPPPASSPSSSASAPSSAPPHALHVPSHASQRPQKHSKSKKSKSHKGGLPTPGQAGSSPGGAWSSLSPANSSRPSPDWRLLPVTPASVASKGRPADGKAIALTTAQGYDTSVLLKGLEDLGLLQGAVNLLGEAIFLPRWSPDSVAPSHDGGEPLGSEEQGSEVGEVFIFESGTVVLWGLSMHAAETFLRKVIRGSHGRTDLGWVEEGRYSEPETEVLEYWVGKGPTRMSGDSILLSDPPAFSLASGPSTRSPPTKDLLERLAFSAGMARVTKLGVYEEQFDAFAEGVAGIPKLLESGSESPVKKTDIIKRVGTLHSFRQKLNLEDENLLDEPEFLWEDATLHGHYTAVCKALEFETRLTTLNDRVDYAFSLQTTLMELLNAQTSHRLEWIIIILIAFEISLVLIREGVPFMKGHDEEGNVTPPRSTKREQP
ncbi:hypothetical protein JCM10212_006798 [Sporobolomyces blumeae]